MNDCQPCLFCGGDGSAPDHLRYCDGRQGGRDDGLHLPPATIRFDGADYVPPRDDPRLTCQYTRIWSLMQDAAWRTLADIERATGDPPASISAQLRHMRKRRFGAHTVNRRYLGNGLYEYQVMHHVVSRTG